MSDVRATARDSSIDAIQSGEYAFPYHYIPTPDTYPMFSRGWSYAPSYIAAINLAREWLLSDTGFQGNPAHRHMDYGCGDGGFVFALNQDPRFRRIAFEGIDFDSRAIDWANIFSSGAENVTFHCRDLAKLEAETYDSGTLVEVLEHIPPNEALGFVAKIAASLKPGAPLLVTVPSTEKPVTHKHYRHFTFETLIACFDAHFDVDDCFGFERRGLIAKLITRLMMRYSYHIETAMTSRMLVKDLQTRHQTLDGCGRIGLCLRKKGG